MCTQAVHTDSCTYGRRYLDTYSRRYLVLYIIALHTHATHGFIVLSRRVCVHTHLCMYTHTPVSGILVVALVQLYT